MRAPHAWSARALAVMAIVVATACTDVESPSELDDGPTREDTLDATEFDVAPSP